MAEIVTGIGGGLNWQRRGLVALLERLREGAKLRPVVAHQDRLARFGFELVAWFVEANGGEVVVLGHTDSSPGRELVEDLLAVVHSFSRTPARTPTLPSPNAGRSGSSPTLTSAPSCAGGSASRASSTTRRLITSSSPAPRPTGRASRPASCTICRLVRGGTLPGEVHCRPRRLHRRPGSQAQVPGDRQGPRSQVPQPEVARPVRLHPDHGHQGPRRSTPRMLGDLRYAEALPYPREGFPFGAARRPVPSARVHRSAGAAGRKPRPHRRA